MLMQSLVRFARNVRGTISLAWAASPRSFVQFALLGAANAAMAPALVLLSAMLVNGIARWQANGDAVARNLPVLLGIWFVSVIQRALGAHLGYGRTLFMRRIELEAERRLLAQAGRVDFAYFEDADFHDRLARAKRDVAWRPGDLTWSILNMATSAVTIVLMMGLLATLHWALVMLSVFAAVISLLLERRVTRRMYDLHYQEAPEERERAYLGDLLVQPRHAKEVRANALAEYLIRRHQTLSRKLYGLRELVFRSASRAALISGIVNGTVTALAFGFVAMTGQEDLARPGGIVLVIGAFTSVSGALGQVSSLLAAVDQHTTFLEDYFRFLNLPTRVRVPDNPVRLPEAIASIDFDDVSFTYPGAERAAVANIDLHIGAGELVALVGDNGAGKSTLVKLLLRFHDVESGAVRVGGVDVRHLEPTELRSRVGVLFQDYTNYELSVREGVAMGLPEAGDDDARILRALRNSASDGPVGRLPNGVNARVGRLFAGAQELSGGEWQRLALARIMFRDAAVWVLDEPSSALDPEAEAVVFSKLRAMLRGRMGIVISHRLSAARMADRIAVLVGGKLVESGTHAELVSSGGRYAQLHALEGTRFQ